MEKIKKRIANLKVAGKLKVYRMTVLVMTLFLVLVALISTLVIRSNIEKITEVWSPSLEYLQDLETMTAKYRIKQYQHLVESDAAVMNSCEEEIKKLESQIQDTDAKLEAIMSANSKAQKGQDDYEVANAAWEEYRAASDEILKLSREGKQQEAAKLMIGEVYEEYKAFAEKLTTLRDKFQVELDRAKTMANVCTIIIFVVIVAAGLADKCEIQLAYAIGVARPVSILVDTFGTGKIDEEQIVNLVEENFELRPAGIIDMLNLRHPIYRQTAAYGHFGSDDIDLPWEHTDKAESLKRQVGI